MRDARDAVERRADDVIVRFTQCARGARRDTRREPRRGQGDAEREAGGFADLKSSWEAQLSLRECASRRGASRPCVADGWQLAKGDREENVVPILKYIVRQEIIDDYLDICRIIIAMGRLFQTIEED
jgi:hypothetical protein